MACVPVSVPKPGSFATLALISASRALIPPCRAFMAKGLEFTACRSIRQLPS